MAVAILSLVGASGARADVRSDHAGSALRSSAPVHARAARLAPAFTVNGLIGPDVSMWDGCFVDWTQVSRGSAFAFVKATEGTTWTDPCFAGHWQQLAAAGVARGAYDFARPGRPVVAGARAEARHFLGAVAAAGGSHPSLPPVLDVEAAGGLKPRALRLWIQTWIDTVRAATHRGRMTIYTGGWFWNARVGAWAPKRALLWASAYGPVTPRVAGFAAPNWWQYTDGKDGPLPHLTQGVGRAGDHSVWLGDPARLRRLAQLAPQAFAPIPVAPGTLTPAPGSQAPSPDGSSSSSGGSSSPPPDDGTGGLTGAG